MNVSDILIRVQRTFGDESSVQVTQADVIRWINDGQREAAMQNDGLFEEVAFLDLTEDQEEYSIPDDSLMMNSVKVRDAGNVSYFNVAYRELHHFDEYVDGWDGTLYGTGNPVIWTERKKKIILFPTPSYTIVNGIKIRYSRYPVDVISDTDTPEIPEYYHQMIVNYCLMKAFEMDEDYDASQLKAVLVQQDLNYNAQRPNHSENKTYPVILPMLEDYM